MRPIPGTVTDEKALQAAYEAALGMGRTAHQNQDPERIAQRTHKAAEAFYKMLRDDPSLPAGVNIAAGLAYEILNGWSE